MEANKVRVRRTVAEKRRIVELTLQPGASVERVAQAEGVNSHQVFQWRRAYRSGKLVEFGELASALLPVVLAATDSAQQVQRERTVTPKPKIAAGAIHIELPGRATITVEHGADRAVLRTILTTLASNDRLQGNPALENLRQ
jgi:transposase